MALVPASTVSSLMELDVDGSVESLSRLLDAQKELFHGQIDQLQRLVVTQCKLTGVNPLSQEMAAGALSIKIGKKPRDLLNPKAIKYMQSVFAIKDTIGKKETREISALCGITVTQVRDFLSGQRSRVRKFARLAREKAVRTDRTDTVNIANEGNPTCPDTTLLVANENPNSAVDTGSTGECAEIPACSGHLPSIQDQNIPGRAIDPKPAEVVAPLSSTQEETMPGIDAEDKTFLESIFSLMRKEEAFSGQVKLMEWILQIHNSAVLIWFLTKGGITILAAWLDQAAIEEQTTVLRVILKVLCHLPLHKALPAQMSAVLQTVNKLRFYRTPDISNRARVLLSRWSKMLVRSQSLKNPSTINSINGEHKEMIMKQRIREILSDEFWQSKVGIPEDILALTENTENDRKLEPKQTLKLLTASCDGSNRKHVQSVSSIKTKERRKVLLVEQLDDKSAGRAQAGKAAALNHSRPISADDIQKAKMRAMFMQHKYGKAAASSSVNGELPAGETNKIMPLSTTLQRDHEKSHNDNKTIEAPTNKRFLEASREEQLLKRLKMNKIKWQLPPEMATNSSWRVGEGESSKELQVQAQRINREKETRYPSPADIPPNPKEPWDVEMDFDDSLTPEIPIEQQPDVDLPEDSPDPPPVHEDPSPETTTTATSAPPASPAPLASVTSSGSAAAPDLELLAVLLKNPDLVFALTSGHGKNLTGDEMVALLDKLKQSGGAPAISVNGTSGVSREMERRSREPEPEPTSLPSPTPPSDAARATGWRSAFPAMLKAPLPLSVPHKAPTLPPQPQQAVLPIPPAAATAGAAATAAVAAAPRNPPANSLVTHQGLLAPPLPPQHSFSPSYPIQHKHGAESLHLPVQYASFSAAMASPRAATVSTSDSASFLELSYPESYSERPPAAEFLLQGHRDQRYDDLYALGEEEISVRSRPSRSWSPGGTPVRSPQLRHGHGRSYGEGRREHGWSQQQDWSRQRGNYRSGGSDSRRWRDRDRDRRR